MIITKSREYTVNMGNYESLKFGGSVSLDTDDVMAAGLGPEKVIEIIEDKLTQVLAEDLAEARALTNTKDSYVLSWKEK